MTQPVAPETTLVVILGASEWPDADLEGSSAFADSANDLRDFFLDRKGFGLPEQNLLNLFDKRHAPSDLLVALGDFLKLRIEQADYFDLVLYYVGHGFFAGNNDDFYLALKGTKARYKNETSLRVKNLADRVGESARHLRRYILFDCCFAAAALPVFQSALGDVAMHKAAQAFPARGTLLYCSSSKDNASRAPKDFRYTMFSGCLLQALREGRASFGEKLSMTDVDLLVRQNLDRVFRRGAWVRPELHSPRQDAGDLRELPLFPNPARRQDLATVPPAATSTKLTVSSSCAASLFLNGKHCAELHPYQPYSVDALQPGVYRILLKTEGFQSEDELVELKRGEHLLRNYAPKPLAKPIASQPPASEPPKRQTQLPEKKPRLKLWQGIVIGVAFLFLGYRLLPEGSSEPEKKPPGSEQQLTSKPLKQDGVKPSADLPTKKEDPLHKAGDLKTFREAGFEITMAWCPPGSFLMGSPESEKQRDKDETQHRVTLTQGFWLAQTEVTQAQWRAVMDSNPSSFKGDTLPVDSVSWNDATEFIKRLNAKVGKEVYRLPTEAEWEYACRARTTTPFNTGENLTTDQANYNGYYPYAGFPKGEYKEKTIPVGSFPGNAWGLQDMHGNLWEWCQDWRSDYAAGEQVDPGGPDSGQSRVLRGGSWFVEGRFCRSANRIGFHPDYRNDGAGFRLARGQKEPEAGNR